MTGPDDPHADRIRALPLWSGPVQLEPLAGGITNRNFLVRDGEAQFVARIGEERHVLGVDRRNELLCHRAAEALLVAPPVVYGEDGILVSRFIPSRTLDATSAREGNMPRRVAHLLRTLHEGSCDLVGDLMFFSPFQVNRTYVQTSRAMGAKLPTDIDAMTAAMRTLSRTLRPYVPTLCHNDMLPANVLDDGERVWIVDWEYAGMGHPFFDLAGFSVNCGFSDAMDSDFLTAYQGYHGPDDLRELRILKVASLLREALWSVVQTVASDLDFDFGEYARVHFAKFRQAFAALGGDERAAF